LGGIFSFTGLQNLDVLSVFVFNPGILVAILFVTMISAMLISKSLSLADEFANSIKTGIGEDTVLKGIKKLTLSTIKYIEGGVQRELKDHARKRSYDKSVDRARGKLPRDDDGRLVPPPAEIDISGLDTDTVIDLYAAQEDAKAAGTYRTPSGAPIAVPGGHPLGAGLRPGVLERDNNDWNEYREARRKEDEVINDRLNRYGLKPARIMKNGNARMLKALDDVLHDPDPAKALGELKDPKVRADIVEFVNDLKSEDEFKDRPESPLLQIKAAAVANARNYEFESRILGLQSVSSADKSDLVAAIKNDRVDALLVRRPELGKVYARVAKDIASMAYKDRKKFADLEYRVKLRENYELSPRRGEITPRDVMLSLASEEIEEIQGEIDALGSLDGNLRRAWLSHRLKKYKKRLEDIKEKTDDELLDELDDAIAERKKRMKRNRIWRELN
jgi:hypothetical protein